MKSRLNSALALARQGFRIFPLRPATKAPYADEPWKSIMTTDEATIRQWFATREDMNYAVVCDDKHVVVDADDGGHHKDGSPKQGTLNFHEAEDLDDGMPLESIFDKTFRVRTPKGGVHLYFTCTAAYANSANKIIPDVDVRGPDGYVVGPGCATMEDLEHNTVEGEYVVEIDDRIAPLPQWLQARLESGGRVGERAANANTAAVPLDMPAAIERAKQVLRQRRVAEEGQAGDLHTYVTACHVKDEGISEEKCVELMFSEPLFDGGATWNDVCEPPWEYDGLATKVRNAYRYGNRQPGAKADALTVAAEDLQASIVGEQTLSEGEHLSAVFQPIGEDDRVKDVRASIKRLDKFMTTNQEVESLIAGWIPAFGVTAILAKRGTGKTVIMADLANRIATDMEWNGSKIADNWSVIYLCGEDPAGFQRQMKAWQIEYGVVPASDRLLVADAVPNLMDATHVKMWAAELKEMFKDRKVCVMLDTWQRATSTASQNDDKEMQRAVHHAEALARYLGGCAVIAFHPPKGNEETITGSAVIENSTVSILHVNGQGSERKLHVMRIKGRGEGNYLRFSLKEIPVGGHDVDGKEITGVIPDFHGGSGHAPSDSRINEDEQIRKIVVDLVAPVMSINNGKMSLGDIAQAVTSYSYDHPLTPMAKYFGNTGDPEGVLKLVKHLFNPSVVVFYETELHQTLEARVVDGKLIMR